MDKPTATIVKAVAADNKAAQATRKVVEHSHRKIAKSAETLEQSAVAQEDSADRRTALAADRTLLAAERTYAAWMRTGLAALAAGIGAKPLLADFVADWLALATSVVLVLFAIFCFAAAVWRQIDRAVPPPTPDVRRLSPALLVAFSAFLSLVAAAVIVGLWAG